MRKKYKPASSMASIFHDRKVSDQKLFGKYNEFILLIFGFVLSGLVGNYLSQVYTTKNAQIQLATEIFRDKIKLVGERTFIMNQVYLALKERRDEPKVSEDKLRDRIGEYRAVLQNWNSARPFNREMLRLYFGEEIWNKERKLHYYLRAWGASLEMEYKKPGDIDMLCLENKRDEILFMAHEFGFLLAEVIREGKISDNSRLTSKNEEEMPKSFFSINQ